MSNEKCVDHGGLPVTA